VPLLELLELLDAVSPPPPPAPPPDPPPPSAGEPPEDVVPELDALVVAPELPGTTMTPEHAGNATAPQTTTQEPTRDGTKLMEAMVDQSDAGFNAAHA
jgi:hypothetical protein